MFDVHCHILPGVDDGAEDEDESLQMLTMAYKDGIHRILATSHYYCGMPARELEKREKAYLRVCDLAHRVSDDLRIYPGAEVFYENDILDELKEGKVPTLNHTKYILVEFPVDIDYSYIFHGIQKIRYLGYLPIVAHVERYASLVNMERVESLVHAGACIQANAASVMGNSGWRVKRYLLKLMKAGLIQMIGTDAHGTGRRRPLMQDCRSYLGRKLGEDYSREICCENAARIVKGDYISE